MPTGQCRRLERISVWCFRYSPLQAKTHLPDEMHNAPSSLLFVCTSQTPEQHANTKRAHFRSRHLFTSSQLFSPRHRIQRLHWRRRYHHCLAPFIPRRAVNWQSSSLPKICSASACLHSHHSTTSSLPASIQSRHTTPSIAHDERRTHRAL